MKREETPLYNPQSGKRCREKGRNTPLEPGIWKMESRKREKHPSIIRNLENGVAKREETPLYNPQSGKRCREKGRNTTLESRIWKMESRKEKKYPSIIHNLENGVAKKGETPSIIQNMEMVSRKEKKYPSVIHNLENGVVKRGETPLYNLESGKRSREKRRNTPL
ncbi:hypothetical protein [Cytobacillus gottheilii]|uniref:Uncharacterized protein n=1 Tax=Cytobacillus gottheilii TaxID=859144 RepID=A0ABX8F9H9_9BACI|nr:hypothetical protein [Cytobacillus gottheilii]QVY61078.1 hypothetical protein J1899_19260 [Cytobacillus gottheilii]